MSIVGNDPAANSGTTQSGLRRYGPKKVAAAVAASSLLLATACGIGGGDSENGLAAGDYTVVSNEGVTDSIVVNGTIEPINLATITTPLQTKVLNIPVATGDRVSQDQLLAELDSSDAERQLAAQQQEQSNAQADAENAAQAAQSQLDGVRAQIDQGTHPAIAQAQEGVNQAQAAYNAAVSGQGAPDPLGLAGAQGGSPTDQAFAALQQAVGQRDAAVQQASQERDQLKAQADSAWRQVQSAQNASGANSSLEEQIKESTIYSPIAGIVTSVNAREGDVPQGPLMTVADDSRLTIRAKVREGDVSNISEGNRVTFTSTSTGDKEYTGKVTSISPLGETGEPNPQSGKADTTVNFPVDIEVDGDKDGLRLGGTARAEIITADEPDSLAVPLEAVYDDNGSKHVLVLNTASGERKGTIEERDVTTGAANDVDIAVTGGDLKPGDIVINVPDQYRSRVGDTISITDSRFDPGRANPSDSSSDNTEAASASKKG